MAKKKEVYKCETCSLIIEVLHGADGIPECCGDVMEHLRENSVDAAKEKHVPVLEKGGNTVIVKVGSVEHPMEAKHYIEFIEVITDKDVHREYLKPGGKPTATFEVAGNVVAAREYCTLHGLWKN
jgi:superoxide reductase